MEDAEPGGAVTLFPFEQLLVTDRKQGTAERREHRQLVVGPLDRGECGANGLDFLAIVKRLAADEDMTNAPRLERLYVRLGHVLAETEKPANRMQMCRAAICTGG